MMGPEGLTGAMVQQYADDGDGWIGLRWSAMDTHFILIKVGLS